MQKSRPFVIVGIVFGTMVVMQLTCVCEYTVSFGLAGTVAYVSCRIRALSVAAKAINRPVVKGMLGRRLNNKIYR